MSIFQSWVAQQKVGALAGHVDSACGMLALTVALMFYFRLSVDPLRRFRVDEDHSSLCGRTQIFWSTALVFAALLLLFWFLRFHSGARRTRPGQLSAVVGGALCGLSLPGRAYEILPIAALIGTLFAFAQMVAHSEYTVMRVSGVSIQSMAWRWCRSGLRFRCSRF